MSSDNSGGPGRRWLDERVFAVELRANRTIPHIAYHHSDYAYHHSDYAYHHSD